MTYERPWGGMRFPSASVLVVHLINVIAASNRNLEESAGLLFKCRTVKLGRNYDDLNMWIFLM